MDVDVAAQLDNPVSDGGRFIRPHESESGPFAAARPADVPPSYREDKYVSDEMEHLLALDCPEELIPVGVETLHSQTYNSDNLFPEWLLNTSEWKNTKVNSDTGNGISEILQTPAAQRSHDQVSTSVKWLMEVWDVAKNMGFAKCAAMVKEFKYFKHDTGENIITQGESGLTFYIIISGEAEVIKDGLGVVATLGKGKSFGEIALHGKDLRTATIRASTAVEVLRLHKVGIWRALRGNSKLIVRIGGL
jgi:hypothetical protein